MDDAVRAFIDGIGPGQRPLFDRLHRIAAADHADLTMVLSYGMPTFVVGRRRLHVGVWAHGVSLYGWDADRDGGFVGRHPELVHGKGTIRLRPDDLAAIDDTELAELFRATLAP